MPRIYTSSIIGAPAARVWARVRDFNALPNWHPAIAESRIENGEPADKVGCIRDFRLRNGDRLREKLLGLSDYEMFCTYSIPESAMPVENYVATLRRTPVSDLDRTFIEWTAEFDCAPKRQTDLVDTIPTACSRPGSIRSSGISAAEDDGEGGARHDPGRAGRPHLGGVAGLQRTRSLASAGANERDRA